MSMRNLLPGDKDIETIVGKAPRGVQYGWGPIKFDKILDGKFYSSEKSNIVAIYAEHDPPYAQRCESLLQTDDGHYLLLGEGETCSPWSKRLPDCSDHVVGHAFIPLSVDDAKRWLEIRGKDEEYIELFGEP